MKLLNQCKAVIKVKGGYIDEKAVDPVFGGSAHIQIFLPISPISETEI